MALFCLGKMPMMGRFRHAFNLPSNAFDFLKKNSEKKGFPKISRKIHFFVNKSMLF